MKNGKYELVKAPDGYPGFRYRGKYCYEHHVVWWREHGGLPKDGKILHHINGDHRDNRIENLHEMTVAEHNREHAAGVTMVELVCDHCGIRFVREKRNASNQGQRRHFCGRPCLHESLRNRSSLVQK